jgi:hypothetical protein
MVYKIQEYYLNMHNNHHIFKMNYKMKHMNMI